MTLKIDLHVHTFFSPDSVITPDQLVYYAKKSGLDGVAVTDHDRLRSYRAIPDQPEFIVIPAMEITSLDGHIVGLNVQQEVEKGLPAETTVRKIHQAGGIAIACHPAAAFKKSLGKLANSEFDAIEVVNASTIPFEYSTRKSVQIASRLGIPRVAGSDAHYGPEVGTAYTQIKSELDVDDIVTAIKNGMCDPHGRAIPLSVRLRREIAVLPKRLRFNLSNRGTG